MENKMEPKSINIENIDEQRERISKEVKIKLEKFNNKIIEFNLMTSSKKAGGFFDTNNGIKMVRYDNRYDKDYSFYNLERSDSFEQEQKSGYIFDKGLNKITFIGYLGRTLHSPDRDGNALFITLKLQKNFTEQEDLIQSISKLLDTIVAYKGNDKNQDRTLKQDLIDIAKESITVLEAFKEVSNNFPSNGNISVDSLIQEYRELVK